MSLEELHQTLGKILSVRPRIKDWEVCIPIKQRTMGGTPHVKVKSIFPGIDFDNGKIFFYPEEDLKKHE